MFRKLTGRAGWRLLAATVGAGALIAAGGGAAYAGTVRASTTHTPVPHSKTILVRVRYVLVPEHHALRASTPYPSNCAYNDATCSYDTGWGTYNNGSCTADVSATWWGVPKNVLNVTVGVSSPYLFAGCRAYGTVYFGMNSGPPLAVGPFYSYACALWDPTCASTQHWQYQVQQPVPQSQLTNLNSLYAYITH